MGFDNLNTDAGIATLNTFIADKSYIEGFTASQADVAVFEAIATAPAAGKYPHAARWFTHIASHKASFAQ
jgi:elongation factor 1-beta